MHHIYTYMYSNVCVKIYDYIYICVCIYVHKYVYVHIYIYIYVCIHIQMNIYIYTYIHIQMCVYIIRARTHLGNSCWQLYQCNTLQHTASHCNTLQHTATHCNTFNTHTGNTAGRCLAKWQRKAWIDRTTERLWNLEKDRRRLGKRKAKTAQETPSKTLLFSRFPHSVDGWRERACARERDCGSYLGSGDTWKRRREGRGGRKRKEMKNSKSHVHQVCVAVCCSVLQCDAVRWSVL